jgi:two-component system chemotaxis response regulator CheB
MPGHDILVIGASAGGVEALQQLVSRIPANYPGTIFITLHMAREGRSVLGTILDRSGPLAATTAEDGAPIKAGRIYVAPPDYHLVIRPNRVNVIRGPKENSHRPSIDVMFRSAAQTYGPRVIGIVLSGFRDDGTAGLVEIKKAGGIAIVQDPAEAAVPHMPQNAAEKVKPDYVLSIGEIPGVLMRLAMEHEVKEDAVPAHLEEHLFPQDEKMDRNGRPSAFTCPACSGTLWELDEEGILRFRCRVGHAYSAETMFASQVENVENSMYAALRALEENSELARRIAKRARSSRQEQLAEKYEAQAEANELHAQLLREALLTENGHHQEPRKGPEAAPEEVLEPEHRVHRRGTTPRKKSKVSA